MRSAPRASHEKNRSVACYYPESGSGRYDIMWDKYMQGSTISQDKNNDIFNEVTNKSVDLFQTLGMQAALATFLSSGKYAVVEYLYRYMPSGA